MTLPAAPSSVMMPSEPAETDGPPTPLPRFPWISLVLMVLAVFGVLTAIGLAVSAGIQSSNDAQRAIDDAVRVGPHQQAQVHVSGPDDVIHIWVVIPGDRAAWRADGTLDYPDQRPFVARQDGTRLLPDDELTYTDGFGFDAQNTLTDGSTLVKIDDVHPLRAGTVDVQTQDLAPGNELRLALEPSRAEVNHRLMVAGLLALASILVGLAALTTFIVMLVRRHRAKPRRPNRPPPPGPMLPYSAYQPYPGYAAYPGYPSYPGYPPGPPPSTP